MPDLFGRPTKQEIKTGKSLAKHSPLEFALMMIFLFPLGICLFLLILSIPVFIVWHFGGIGFFIIFFGVILFPAYAPRLAPFFEFLEKQFVKIRDKFKGTVEEEENEEEKAEPDSGE
ncbi:hypothetical protein ACFL35_14555 [Candidatus Riflebacteria bacterium]